MKKEQLNMTEFHELLWDESADDQLMIVLRKMRVIEDPKAIVKAVRVNSLGSWSGWSM